MGDLDLHHSPVLGGGPSANVTLLEGVTFCVCERSGDIEHLEQGLYYRDTRFLSCWRLEVDGQRLGALDARAHTPWSATFVGRRPPSAHLADSALVVTRSRLVGNGMLEEITVTNHGREPAAVDLALTADSDFAGLFEVKEGRVRPRPAIRRSDGPGALALEYAAGSESRAVRVEGEGAHVSGQTLRWQVVVSPQQTHSVIVRATLAVNGTEVTPRFLPGAAVEDSQPAERLAAWRAAAPAVSSADERLAPLLTRSVDSLGALRIFHPSDPDRTVVAAGAPWFMTLFGRDSLLTSWMMLPLDPDLALSTARTLAELQGREVDPLSEEQPGRILHEIRSGPQEEFSLGNHNIYYGSIDATPLFVMLIGELHRWGGDRDRIAELLPHVWRALLWIQTHGDLDGDGFLEYRRATDRGLRNQGWKDSYDSVNDRTGRLIEPPVAPVEAQGYAYAAWLAGARLADHFGEPERAATYRRHAAALRARFRARFWLPEHRHHAAALGPDKQPVDGLVSNVGHCLWTGIVEDDHAAALADHLTDPSMFSGFGVRTLASHMGAYNPVSYHNGSVWPHDTAIVAAGLMRYGFLAQAQQIIGGLLDAGARLGGVLPELFCGFDRSRFSSPVPYPTSCYPQAWAAAAPLLLLRSLLRFDPDVPSGVVHCAPAVPAQMLPLHVRGLQLAGHCVDVWVDTDGVQVAGLPPDITLVRQPAPLPAPQDEPLSVRSG